MTAGGTPIVNPKSLVMHSAARHYDALAWVLTRGRERDLRERMADVARLQPAEAVLDVGCGTGTLAILAKRRVGDAGAVHGVDASPEMIALARQQAARQGVDASFETASADALPLPHASFDAVLSTLMLHHLPRPMRERLMAEIRRVLKPGGRVLAVDFEAPAPSRRRLLARLHRHGCVPLRDIVGLLQTADLRVVETGSVGVADLQFAVATVAGAGTENARDLPVPTHRSLEALPMSGWFLAVAAVAVVATHAVVFRAATSRMALPILGIAAIAALVVVGHVGGAGGMHAVLRRRTRHRG